MRSSLNRFKGFTNFELVIITFVIILLVAVILPNLFKTFESAKISTLDKNTKLIFQRIILYAKNHHGQYPNLNTVFLKQLIVKDELINPFTNFSQTPILGPNVYNINNLDNKTKLGNPGDILVGNILNKTKIIGIYALTLGNTGQIQTKLYLYLPKAKE